MTTFFIRSVGQQVFRSEEHTSELQSQSNLVCRLLLEKKKKKTCSSSSNNERKPAVDRIRSVTAICRLLSLSACPAYHRRVESVQINEEFRTSVSHTDCML